MNKGESSMKTEEKKVVEKELSKLIEKTFQLEAEINKIRIN